MEMANTTMVDWVKQRWYGTTILMCVFCLLIGTGLAMVIGRTAPAEYWIIWGGNGDPGNGQGGGFARDQMVAGGWVSYENSFQVTWQADIGQNTRNEAQAAMPSGHDAVNRFCANRRCVVAGFSLGNAPAIQLASETGNVAYMFGAPQPSTGIFHNPWVHNPLVQFWTDFVGGLDQNQFAPAGSQAFYHTADPYANGGPQCGGPGWFGIDANKHYIISRWESNGSHIWTGPDGVLMHEVGYVPQPGVPSSGSDPAPFWSLCPPSLQPPEIPTIPPGTPPMPGVPTGG